MNVVFLNAKEEDEVESWKLCSRLVGRVECYYVRHPQQERRYLLAQYSYLS